MKAQKTNTKYLIVDSTEVSMSEGDTLITSDIVSIRQLIEDTPRDDFVIVAENSPYANDLALIAFETGKKLQVSQSHIYDLKGTCSSKEATTQDLLVLLSLATENRLAESATQLIFNKIKNRIPIKYDLGDTLSLLDIHASGLVDKEAIKKRFCVLYKDHVSSITEAIRPKPRAGLISQSISYSVDLSLFLRKNDGLFVLNAAMAAGKTLHGLLPLFKDCLKQNKKVMLITPTIALSKALALGFDKSAHYSQHKNAESLNDITGLICCVNSAVEKDYFHEFAQSCDVIIVDEWEECANQLTEKMSDKKKLSYRATLTARLYTLLMKSKVVIADALFCDMSARHIIAMTKRKITLLDSADTSHPSRTLKLYNRYEHIDLAATQAKETRCEVGFSDAGQKLSNKYFELAEAISSDLNGKINLITADYLKSRSGQTFFDNPLKQIKRAAFSLFSPAITSGTNFPFDQFTRVNLFASETISPSKLIQSSGRFRNTNTIQASFSERKSNYHPYREVIITTEIVETTTEDEYPSELDSLKDNVWADMVVERILQDRKLRQHYANNTLLMLQKLGVKIERHTAPRLSSTNKTQLSEVERALPVLTDEEYQQLLSVFDMLSFDQREQIRIYEALSFYNILSLPELHQKALDFDNFGKGQIWIKHLQHVRGSGEQVTYKSEEKIRQLVSMAVLETLKLNSVTFDGTFGYPEIEQLNQFFLKGSISIKGKSLPMRTIRKPLFGISGKKYENMAWFSKSVLAKLFGLEQVQADRNKSKETGEYSYKVCPDSIEQLELYYRLFTSAKAEKSLSEQFPIYGPKAAA